MVDVGGKGESERRAGSRSGPHHVADNGHAVERGDAPKGDVLGTARIAGIQAAKRTDELIPLAHPLPLSFVDVEATIDPAAGTVTFDGRGPDHSGRASRWRRLTACAVAALTVYDMVKGIERGSSIEEVALLEKTGGKEDWRRGT